MSRGNEGPPRHSSSSGCRFGVPVATPAPVEIKQADGKATVVLPANAIYVILFK